MRPTVVNCFSGGSSAALSSTEAWFRLWLAYMFDTPLPRGAGGAGKGADNVSAGAAGLLSPLSRAKYPAVTAEEEALGLPLQTLALALFDAVLVHLMNQVAGPEQWPAVRASVCDSLNLRKNDRLLEV